MPTLPDSMPASMQRLARDDVGRPVPYFVEYVDGKPDFRVMNMAHYFRAINRRLCWVCGERLSSSQVRQGRVEVLRGEHTFVAGPMCLINRLSAEPPAHYECAEWSARACPFLSNPQKVRREGGLEHHDVGIIGGVAIMRNPKVTGLFSVRRWWVEATPPHGQVIRFDRIVGATWVCEGRPATAAEVRESVDTGLPELRAAADAEGAGAHLDASIARAEPWLPANEH